MDTKKKDPEKKSPEPSEAPAAKADAKQLVASLQEHVRNGFGVTDEQLQAIADAL